MTWRRDRYADKREEGRRPHVSQNYKTLILRERERATLIAQRRERERGRRWLRIIVTLSGRVRQTAYLPSRESGVCTLLDPRFHRRDGDCEERRKAAREAVTKRNTRRALRVHPRPSGGRE